MLQKLLLYSMYHGYNMQTKENKWKREPHLSHVQQKALVLSQAPKC
jgi:hypothetical protein